MIRKVMDKDPYRPTYHLTSPIGWMFDPAGAFYYQGKYHVFTYRNICFLLSHSSLDHYVSEDLIHWKQWPVGPFADCSLDFRGIWLNNHFIDDNGVLSVIYTAHGYEGNEFTKHGILAQSYDGMISFENKKAVIDKHHDGHTWKEGDTWYSITTYQYRGLQPGDDGDEVVLLSSKDLNHWTVIGPIFTKKKDGREGAYHREKEGFTEFPYLVNIGGKDVLFLGGNPTSYEVGNFDKKSFTFIPDNPDEYAYALDYANTFNCENLMIVDNKGEHGKSRRIVLSLISDIKGIYEGVPWHGALAIPRTLELIDNHLHQEPVAEIESLRGEHINSSHIKVEPNKAGYIEKCGDALEIICEFEPCDALIFGLKVCISEDNQTFLKIYYDTTTGEYGMDGNFKKEWELIPGEILGLGKGPTFLKKGDHVSMRVFIDKSIVESFVNGQTCTAVLQDNNPNHKRLDLFSEGGVAICKSLDIWEMKRVYT